MERSKLKHFREEELKHTVCENMTKTLAVLISHCSLTDLKAGTFQSSSVRSPRRMSIAVDGSIAVSLENHFRCGPPEARELALQTGV
jgi:hypothetical protein